jgi:hypothetical protein
MQQGRQCDCDDFGVDPCILQVWNTDNAPIDFDSIEREARSSIDSVVRKANNVSRHGLYRKVFSKLEFSDWEEGRKELPNCAVARVRQIYPSTDGNYMGFLES